jgi:transposase InsO family protein
VLGASKSGYYKWLKSEPSKRATENQELTEKIRKIHVRSRHTYGSPRISEHLRAEGVPVSRMRVARLMKRAGIHSNAVAESFFKTLKVECLYQHRLETFKQAELLVFEYIESWYNTQRRHSALGYRSPAEYEQLLLTKNEAA